MKVALYARVSMDEQGTTREQDPENQLMAMRDYCRLNLHEIVGEYVDRCSGAAKVRPEFVRLLLDAKAHKFDLILVWKLDRLTRESMGKVIILFERLKANNINLISTSQSWCDTRADNPFLQVVLAVMAFGADMERQNIAARTKLGIAAKRANGSWGGGRPKGAKDKTPRKKRDYNPPSSDPYDLL